jgi:hypothetical protein
MNATERKAIGKLEARHLKDRSRNPILIGEELDWKWDEDDMIEAERMYRVGIPLRLIAQNFGRLEIETGIMLAIRSHEGRFDANDYGSVKPNDGKETG